MTMNAIVKGNTLFAIDLYHQLIGNAELLSETGGNLFYSPYSISTAFALAYSGAKGETNRQIAKTLHFPPTENPSMNGQALSEQEFHEEYGALIDQLHKQQQQKNGKYELSIANALWGQKDYPFIDTFIKLNERFYNAGLENVDFTDESEREVTRQKINTWTEEQTNHKIKNLIPPGFLNEITRLVLTNAVYLRSRWIYQFDERFTENEKFYVSSDKIVDTPLMCQTKDFEYAENEILQILELPYKGYDLRMLVLLPKEKNGLTDLEQRLSMGNLGEWFSQMKRMDVEVYLPKFKIEASFELNEILRQMGITDAFSYGPADFSGMDGTRLLFFSSVLHKTFIEVNEKETEAAAATAMAFGAAGIPEPNPPKPPVFRADHPFLFLIQDIKTQSILFTGRLVNPTNES